MAWEWSHAPEAYRDAEANLRALPANELGVIWAEWQCAESREYGEHEFNGRKYGKAIRRFHSRLRRDVERDLQVYGFDGNLKPAFLEECQAEVWERMSEFSTCTNGGWEAYACPWGCGPHLISFSRAEETAEV